MHKRKNIVWFHTSTSLSEEQVYGEEEEKVFTYKVTGGTEEWKVKDFGKGVVDCSSKKSVEKKASRNGKS